MKISVKRTGPGIYTVAFDDTTLAMGAGDVKHLVLEAVSALTPGVLPARSARDEARALADRLKCAKSENLQQFILAAQDDDILIFLKGNEDDQPLLELLFANMSEHKHKILSEDLHYENNTPLNDDQLAGAVVHLGTLAQRVLSEDDAFQDDTLTDGETT